MIPLLPKSDYIPGILAGTITMIATPVKPQPTHDKEIFFSQTRGIWVYGQCGKLKATDKEAKSPYGKPGDVLYVRETWISGYDLGDCGIGCEYGCICPKWGYKAYWQNDWQDIHGWKSPATMPREAARIFLEVINVTVKRVQEVTEKEIIQLGGVKSPGDILGNKNGALPFRKPFFEKVMPGSWERNDHIWLCEFKKV